MTNIKIILASGSPRRKELLAQAGYDFDVCPSLSEEDLEVMAPSEYVMLLAKMKADEVCNRLIADQQASLLSSTSDIEQLCHETHAPSIRP